VVPVDLKGVFNDATLLFACSDSLLINPRFHFWLYPRRNRAFCRFLFGPSSLIALAASCHFVPRECLNEIILDFCFQNILQIEDLFGI
jgi:hypothetical protein